MTVTYDHGGGIAHITFARGDSLSAMSRRMYADVNEVLPLHG
jgi:enoyl-CoA hydratase/carnithine racemase